MVSNGMSRRRLVLKRPIVCKTKKPADCGACTLVIDIGGQIIQVNGVFNLNVHLDCDPKPKFEQFVGSFGGAFGPLNPLNVVDVNIATAWPFLAPGAPGVYLLAVKLVNKSACRFYIELYVPVYL
jgi:hypothetical protein